MGGVSGRGTDQVQNRNLHHTLVKVCSSVLNNFDRDDLLSLEILTFYDLPEGTLTKNVEDKVTVLMTRLFGTKNVVDIKNVVTILIIIAVIFYAFARLGKDSAWIPSRLVLECWVAYPVCRREMGRQSL
jgi:hypothetical protein